MKNINKILCGMIIFLLSTTYVNASITFISSISSPGTLSTLGKQNYSNSNYETSSPIEQQIELGAEYIEPLSRDFNISIGLIARPQQHVKQSTVTKSKSPTTYNNLNSSFGYGLIFSNLSYNINAEQYCFAGINGSIPFWENADSSPGPIYLNPSVGFQAGFGQKVWESVNLEFSFQSVNFTPLHNSVELKNSNFSIFKTAFKYVI